MFLFLFGQTQLAFTFLLSALFRSTRTAVVAAYLLVLATGLMGYLLLDPLMDFDKWCDSLASRLSAQAAACSGRAVLLRRRGVQRASPASPQTAPRLCPVPVQVDVAGGAAPGVRPVPVREGGRARRDSTAWAPAPVSLTVAAPTRWTVRASRCVRRRGLYELGSYAFLGVYRNEVGMQWSNLGDDGNGMVVA